MKLFEIFIENNLEYGDYDCQTKLVVANSHQEAETRAELFMREEYDRESSFEVTEISEVDGFKIKISTK